MLQCRQAHTSWLLQGQTKQRAWLWPDWRNTRLPGGCWLRAAMKVTSLFCLSHFFIFPSSSFSVFLSLSTSLSSPHTPHSLSLSLGRGMQGEIQQGPQVHLALLLIAELLPQHHPLVSTATSSVNSVAPRGLPKQQAGGATYCFPLWLPSGRT